MPFTGFEGASDAVEGALEHGDTSFGALGQGIMQLTPVS